MAHTYWNDWYCGWGWFLGFGMFFLMFSSLGNWGYTYRAHQKHARVPQKDAFDILDSRYVKGELTREEYARMKSEIAGDGRNQEPNLPGISASTRA